MIEVKNLNKKFGDKTIIDDVSVKMDSGKCNLIIGSSGSGKTVFMKCLVGLFVPDAGEILYQGQDFVKMNGPDRKDIRKQIGMLFQGSALFDSLTVEKNIMFPLNMFKGNITFCSTVKLSKSADPWNSIPICFRISFLSGPFI